MKKLHQLVTLTLVLTFATSSIYGQDPYYQQDEYSSAYAESSNTAHWSVYIPIAILVGAAIWFGVADQGHERHHSSDSQDGLGSIDNSKRHSSSNRSSSYSGKSGRSSHYKSFSRSSSGSHSCH